MTYFDLQTVTFLYAPGLVCSIGWKPEVAGSHSPGSYDVSFGVVDSDPAAPGPTENPHTRMTSLFRELLNTSDQGGSLLDAIQLLRSTLPLIQATLTLEAPTAPVSINLWQRSISCFCFIYEAPRHRFVPKTMALAELCTESIASLGLASSTRLLSPRHQLAQNTSSKMLRRFSPRCRPCLHRLG